MGSSKLKTPLKARTQLPGHHLLSPNDDEYEKAQARAARAAATRRKSSVGMENLDPETAVQNRPGKADLLSKEHILELYQNCIKLATENKINQRNSWELGLIDHLSEIIQDDDQGDAETNFQKASCTLEAGVKIYSYRVDSVHTEAYKVLGGLNRTTTDNKDDARCDDNDQQDDNDEGQDQENSSKILHKKTSAASPTLESSYDAINVKKFDVAFTVDPMFHQMSAQFDEGGAKGLLLNTLSIYSGDSISFDSNEVPSKKAQSGVVSSGDMLAMIDLFCIKDCIDQMKASMLIETEISPTLKEFIFLDDLHSAEAATAISGGSEFCSWMNDEMMDDTEDRMSEVDNAGASNYAEGPAPESFDAHTDMSLCSDSGASNGPGYEDNDDYTDNGELAENDDSFNYDEHTVNWIAAGLGFTSKNAWVGPEHWKYRKLGDQFNSLVPPDADRSKKKKKNEKFTLDFINPVDIDMTAFVPPSDPKSLLLPQTKNSASTLLPEDCHYQAKDLVKLFLLPSVMCINRKGRKKTAMQKDNVLDKSQVGMQSEGDDTGIAGDWDDENAHSDVEDLIDGTLIPHPRKVQKVEVHYEKLSKQVDLRVLKETLWKILQQGLPEDLCEEASSGVGAGSPGSSFQKLLRELSTENASAAFQDISVHLCFICLLHLANEHNLYIKGCPDLNELFIYNVPPN